MSFLVAFTLVIAAGAPAAADPAASACRAAHAADPPAHIACLESALRERSVSGAHDDLQAGKSKELGSEQVRAAQRTPDTLPPQATVQIASVTYNSTGRGVFRMENGQVWRETERTPERQRLAADRQYTARIERGTLGGYRMYVDGVRRMVKVERVE